MGRSSGAGSRSTARDARTTNKDDRKKLRSAAIGSRMQKRRTGPSDAVVITTAPALLGTRSWDVGRARTAAMARGSRANELLA